MTSAPTTTPHKGAILTIILVSYFMILLEELGHLHRAA